ncbi:Gfo/Idh/MocA family protein [Oscillatoria acuminata]|uniref:Putative dehydrogenase n=1 Tax=Oscillatoria acuminata PCC 6304 TaxID=56110 RepID=K9TF20_9CYAN|nr:Gfo/Idh/MocA family oxidoreductase [Oscillatoria acuminata]AFY81008.1 putative dehydrogenase [Oscillatoria acuminata PCC 6304]
MSQPIGIAILGAGRWGVHLIRNFLNHPQARVMAVVDPHQERLTSARSQFNLDESVILTTNWQDIKQLPGLEAVAVATPAATHYALISDALDQNYHVLAEKPLTLDPAECQELSQRAQQRQLQLLVDHTYLFHPAVIAGTEVVQGGRLGELRYGYATRTHLGPVRPDVDALWDLAIHDIAIFNTWLGESPIQVQGTGRVWLQPTPVVGDDSKLFPQGLSDLVMATLTYPSGFQAFIHLCWFNPDKQRRLAVVGDQGTLIFDEMSQDAPLVIQGGYLEPEGDRWIPTAQNREVVRLEKAEPLGRVCDRFLELVRHQGPADEFSGAIATELTTILSALSHSIQQGGLPVQL